MWVQEEGAAGAVELLLTHVRERRGSVEYLASRAGQEHVVQTIGQYWALVAALQDEAVGGGGGQHGNALHYTGETQFQDVQQGRNGAIVAAAGDASGGDDSTDDDDVDAVDLSGTISASQLPPPPPRLHVPRNYSNSQEFWQPGRGGSAVPPVAPPRVTAQRV